MPLETVTRILADLEARKDFLFRDEDGAVAWAYPVAAVRTPATPMVFTPDVPVYDVEAPKIVDDF